METARDILNEPGAPVVLFDRVQLAFDEKVVLRDLSFTLLKGHTKIIPRSVRTAIISRSLS